MSVNITADQVKKLREETGAGMMECKRALVASNGDSDLALDELRKTGKAKAEKRSGKAAAEGIVILHAAGNKALMLEINTETDFVARDANFLAFAKALGELAWAEKISTVADLLAAKMKDDSGLSVEEARQALVGKVGENVVVRRLALSGEGAKTVGSYRHGERIAVIVEIDTDNQELAKDLAMHIAASRPQVLNPEDFSAEFIAKEKEIYTAQVADSGKPAEIMEKMIAGKLKKTLDEASLTGQRFVKNDEFTVGTLLAKNKAKVITFTRFEVGEGIEKVEEDFAQAVQLAQAQGS